MLPVVIALQFCPVPPLAVGSMPVTWVVRPILPQEGAAPTPPEINALPVATSISLESVVAAEAYMISPMVYELWPVPPLAAESVPDQVIVCILLAEFMVTLVSLPNVWVAPVWLFKEVSPVPSWAHVPPVMIPPDTVVVAKTYPDEQVMV